MTLRYTLFLLCALSLGFVSTPGNTGNIISCNGFENCADGSVPLTNALLALEARMDALEVENTALKADNEALKVLLVGVSRITDDNTGQDTLRFANMNVQVVNGSGITGGAKTGTGNLIIGYNELRNDVANPDDRTGSHMLVIGIQNNYSAFGGMVAGRQNTASGVYATISGGERNTASGDYSSVSGGRQHTASGTSSSVSGGFANTASDLFASVSGGQGNQASAQSASVSGGYNNKASANFASLSGGRQNTASAKYASVSGGFANTASGQDASVSGGVSKAADVTYCTVAGDVGTDCVP